MKVIVELTIPQARELQGIILNGWDFGNYYQAPYSKTTEKAGRRAIDKFAKALKKVTE